MHKILRILAIKWSENLQYRGDIILWTIADALVPIIALAIWYSVAQSGNQAFPAQEVFTYYIFLTIVRATAVAWGGYFLSTEILKGDIVRYLIRPLSPFIIHAADNIAVKAFRLIIPISLLAVSLWQWPHLFWPTIYQPYYIVFFLLSVFLATILNFVFDMVTAMLAFWLEDVLQIREYQNMLYEIASGTLIPLAFLPSTIRNIFEFLPFRYMLSTPVEILLGRISGIDIWYQLGIQLLWIIASAITVSFLWKKGLKIYAIPGQ